ncbi:MAG: sugar phosphate isomerase/epimerase family protein [Anaerolineaceae bacterium]
MYRYSLTQWILGNEDVEDSFKRLKKFGYDGIEFAGEPYSTDQEKMAGLLKKYGLICTSLCGIFPENRDLTSGDLDLANKAVQYIRDNIDFAVKVGAPYVIVVPSPVGRTEIPKDHSYDELWANAVTNIRLAADYAESKQVRLCIEAINRYETYFVNTLTKAYQLVREINHPAVGIMADVFHMSLEENNMGASLRMIADQLMHVHVADNTREAAGLGRIDFKEILYVLRDINYQGPLTMEFMPRLANPYASGNVETQSTLMDGYAEQAITYMKTLEKTLSGNS